MRIKSPVALSNKQKKFIEKRRTKLSAEKLAETLNADLNEVKKYIEDNPAQKTPFYFYLIMIFIPVIFFVLLESGLRLFNYGYDLSMWVEAAPGKYMLNWDVARRYFYTVNTNPTSINDIFDIEKKETSFRVFVLGESSAAGYPYMPMGSFSRYIRKRLEQNYPGRNIEVVNIGLTAINSYTLKDFVPDVLDQKPDLVLIYTGHNEYYGALGVGSQESVSNSPFLINLLLYLNEFKTTQLIRDFLKWFLESITVENSDPATGTLMSRMAAEKEIEFNSEKFRAGLNQFELNMSDIIRMLKEENVPLIISTLASNLKDQPPFISINSGNNPPADKIFSEARQEYESGNYTLADSLFRLAKDLDGLRFRAPEGINHIIKNLGKEFSVPVVDADSLFNSLSINSIAGDNLMTDHLHPNLEGYKQIGKLFYEEMRRSDFLPKDIKEKYPYEIQHEMASGKFVFSTFDSTVADYRIRVLKNDWPFNDPKMKKDYWTICRPKNFIDTMAVNFILGNKTWDQAVEQIADISLGRDDIDGFTEHMRVLIYQYPIVIEFYDKLENITLGYLKSRDYAKAEKILNLEYELKPNAFSTKWLGQIALNSGKLEEAIKLLEESISYSGNDEQALYNLAGAYALAKNYQQSYELLTSILSRNPNHLGAQNLANQLKPMVQQN
ncbi:MAG TPA: GDSL-type esterase/lipase family protein [Melioribacteraceae bacterium]|nr:GDSL-type esterase/lipase family protein [Melioribacteraceae bacterium]